MDFFAQLFSNKVLWVSIFACFLAQFIKIFTGKDKRIDFSRIFTSGGMPSSHSALVCSLATVVALNEGIGSSNFAISVVLAGVVMYDAAGVRRAAGKQARVLNQIIANRKDINIQEKLVELLGHTPVEVFVGAILGIVEAIALYKVFWV